MRLSISTSRPARLVSPRGRPQIARTCCSNCERDRALDRPVAAVVNPRRDLVDQGAALGGEEFDGHDADMAERTGKRAGDGRRGIEDVATGGGRGPSSGGGCRSSCSFCGSPRRVATIPSAARARRTENSAVKSIPDSATAGCCADRVPSGCCIAGLANPGLSLAVIAVAAGLKHERHAEIGDGGFHVGQRIHLPPWRDPSAAFLDETLFGGAVLGDGKRARARAEQRAKRLERRRRASFRTHR